MEVGVRHLVVTILILLAGCCPHPDPSGIVVQSAPVLHDDSPDCLQPPQFSLGDVVAVEHGVKIGIIVNCVKQRVHHEYLWVYSVLFQNNTIKYTEKTLTLVESFDWSRPARKGIID